MATVNKTEIIRNLEEARLVLDVMLATPSILDSIARATETVIESLRSGRKLMIAGNGGSAADAQHIAAEFISRFNFDRAPLPAIALTTDTSILTAIGNDYGYEHLFSRQLAGLSTPGDVFIGLSTSGSSPNVVAGLRIAREKGVKTIGLTGSRNGAMNDLCDVLITVPSRDTPTIQQAHITIGHIICSEAERAMFPVEADAAAKKRAA